MSLSTLISYVLIPSLCIELHVLLIACFSFTQFILEGVKKWGGGCTGSFGQTSLINVFAWKRAEIQTIISRKKNHCQGNFTTIHQMVVCKKKKEEEEKK